MFFNNFRVTQILKEMLKNNKEARHYYVEFMKNLPEQAQDILRDCQTISYSSEDYIINTSFCFNSYQMCIIHKDAMLHIEMEPITHKQIAEIPFDQEHDIFLERGYVNLDSPAYFNITFNPDLKIYATSIETPDFTYFIVKQNDGFHLISQSSQDAGIHSTKIDIEDFVIDPSENETSFSEFIDQVVKEETSSKKRKSKKSPNNFDNN